jgi:spore germination cell wall hydrolase CwlJ-like protein
MTIIFKNKVIKVIKEVTIYTLILCLFINPAFIGIVAFNYQQRSNMPRKQNKKAHAPVEKIQRSKQVAGDSVENYDKAIEPVKYYKAPQQNTGLETNTYRSTTNEIQSTNQISADQYQILVRIIKAEAGGEPFEGQVAVAAVLLNRIRSGKFPTSISGNVFRRGEFESVSNGYIWNVNPSPSSHKAASLALKGWDPTGGSLYFFNPVKSTSRWIWSRPVYTIIGNHYFAG